VRTKPTEAGQRNLIEGDDHCRNAGGAGVDAERRESRPGGWREFETGKLTR